MIEILLRKNCHHVARKLELFFLPVMVQAGKYLPKFSY